MKDQRVSEEGFAISDVDPVNPYRSTKINELTAALAKAQSEFTSAPRSHTNKYYHHRYEDLVDVVNASRPALTKNGLSVIQQIKQLDDGGSMLHTILFHSSGQWIESRTRINPAKQEIQTLTSHIASVKRLAYCALIGVVAEDEDDDAVVADIPYRESFAHGMDPSYKYTDKEFEVISTFQREELERELSYPEMEGYVDELKHFYKVQSLADLPKSEYHNIRNRLVQIRVSRQKGKK